MDFQKSLITLNKQILYPMLLLYEQYKKIIKHAVKFLRLVQLSLFIVIVPIINLSGQDHRDWSYNLGTYEVNVRQYTSTGTFAEFETHLDRLKDLGVGILWFMPIHPIGLENRLGSLGSYYSVKDYYGINPEFGTLDDFKRLVDSIHAKGMYVIMDWVGNHTSWDNSLTITNPEWYIKDSQGNFIPPPGTNWSDVIQLDYSKPELRAYMIDAMKFWINEADIDGFRCDAVSFMPLDFWTAAITELKNVKPGILMLAEDDGTQYNTAGFDMTYAWGLHGFGNGILKNIAAGTNNANAVRSYATQESNNYPAPYYRIYFTSNHDENSWHGTVFEQFGDAAEVFAVLTLTFRSMPLIYGGQEAGLNHRLLFFDKDEITWQPHSYAEMYSTLLHLKKKNKALWNGDAGGLLQRVTSTDNPAIFAFIREKESSRVFEILNLTDEEKTVTLQGTLYQGSYRDVFSNDSIWFNENAEITLPAWGYKVYETGSGITGVENEQSSLPEEFILYQNYPNPFNPNTIIQYAVGSKQFVSLKVYDVLGREVVTLISEEKEAGIYEIKFDASSLSSGTYFYRLRASDFIETKKLALIK